METGGRIGLKKVGRIANGLGWVGSLVGAILARIIGRGRFPGKLLRPGSGIGGYLGNLHLFGWRFRNCLTLLGTWGGEEFWEAFFRNFQGRKLGFSIISGLIYFPDFLRGCLW